MGKPVQQSDMKFYYQDMELLQPAGKIHPTWQIENLNKITKQPNSKALLLCAAVRPCVSSIAYCTKSVWLLMSAVQIHTVCTDCRDCLLYGCTTCNCTVYLCRILPVSLLCKFKLPSLDCCSSVFFVKLSLSHFFSSKSVGMISVYFCTCLLHQISF